MKSRVLSIAIARPWQDVYEATWRPQAFAFWASGLSNAALQKDGDVWRGQGADGPIVVRFSPHNAYGVLDHWVETAEGVEIYIPLRVIANADGADVQLTLFQQPGMSDAQFAADAEWVLRDLEALARWLSDAAEKPS